MASFIFEHVKTKIANQSIKLVDVDNIYKIALLDDTILNDVNTYSSKTVWSDISQFEITNITEYNHEGYSQKFLKNIKGENVTSNGTCDDTIPDYKISADNIVYNVSTIDADCAVILRNVGSDPELIAALDLRHNGEKISSNQGTFTIRLDSNSGGYLIIK